MENETLKIYSLMIAELSATTSNNDKKNILARYGSYDNITSLLEYTYSTYMQYHVTSTNCKKKSELCHEQYLGDIFTLLDNLHNRVWTGHEAISYVNGFVHNHKEYEDTIWKIIDRDLKCRVSTTLINRVLPGTIHVFKVALAEAIKDLPDFENERWYASRKLDGVRCIIRKEGDSIKAFSRNGKEFWTIQKILDEVKNISGDIVLDGEVCIVNEHGEEDFQNVMKEIRRKNHTINDPKFFIFDALTLEDFDKQSSETTLKQRIAIFGINRLAQGAQGPKYSHIQLLNQEIVEDADMFHRLSKEAEDAGHEGIMIRKDCGYKGKRSSDMLKVKKFHDAEYRVIDMEVGTIRVVENGKEIEEEMLSNIIVEHKGNRVGVGSGFSIAQRRDYYKNRTKILGKIVTVTYFEESQNQNGKWSLRFPVIKHVHGNKRLV